MFNSPVRLLYFSPTGTTKKVLEAIAEGLGKDKPKHINLTSAGARIGQKRKIRGGLTIIGVPVYTGRVALEAVRGIQRFKAKDAPAVVVVVYGNREYEDALLELRDIAIEIGFIPIAGAVFIGEHSLSTKDVPIALGRPDKEDLDKARLLGKMIRNILGSLESIHESLFVQVPGNFPYRDRGPSFNISPVSDESLCIQCGACVKVCPVEAINLSNNRIETDKKLCIRCCACIKNCLTGSRRLEDPQLLQFAQKLSISFSNRKEPEFYLLSAEQLSVDSV
jgi:ferredoxin